MNHEFLIFYLHLLLVRVAFIKFGNVGAHSKFPFHSKFEKVVKNGGWNGTADSKLCHPQRLC